MLLAALRVSEEGPQLLACTPGTPSPVNRNGEVTPTQDSRLQHRRLPTQFAPYKEAGAQAVPCAIDETNENML